MQGLGPGPHDAAPQEQQKCGRRGAEGGRGESSPQVWTLRVPRQLLTMSDPPKVIDKRHLLWVRQVFASGSKLMNDQAFGRSFQTFDGAMWAHSTGSAIIVIWAAVETLIQPGRPDTTKRLSSSLAALLEPAGAERERLFQRIRSLYEARSSSAHASRSPAAQQLFGVSRLLEELLSTVLTMDNYQLRRSFTTCGD